MRGGAGIRIHPTALVGERASIGEHTRIWAFCNVLDGAVIGAHGQICDRVFIEGGAVIGNNISNHTRYHRGYYHRHHHHNYN